MEAKVSVVIPYFNDGSYIAETLESVRKQTYTNVEIILVDDGSTDEASVRIFDSIEERDGLKKYREKNSGPSAARNLAISHASGTYILPLDADDLIEPTYIEKAVNVLERDPACGIVYCKAKFFGKRSGLWELPTFSMKEMLCHNLIFVTAMFRREDWEKAGGYDTNMKYGIEDYEFWLSILELGRTVYCIPEILFAYRIKKISRTTRLEDSNHLAELYHYILKKHRNLYRKYYFEVISELRKENLEISDKYEHFKGLFPLYNRFKNSGGGGQRSSSSVC